MMEHPLVTVIIPTRDRPDTLLHCLRTVCSQKNDRLEIIVSDNAGDERTREVIASFSDSRLRHIRPEGRLGMSEHWEFALSHASGEWVTIVGDDDGLMPGAISRLLHLASGNLGIRAISSQTCRYVWPSEGAPSKLVVRTGDGAEIRRSSPWLQKVVDGKAEFTSLPFLYTGGWLRADLVREIKEKSGGVFFRSIIPDVYSAIAAASVTDEYLYVWGPLAIAGMSSHSNGKKFMNASKEDEKSMDFFRENKMEFHKELGGGLIQSVPMLVYESYLQSTHLRSGERTSRHFQLALAISKAAPKSRADVLAYCKKIAEKDNLDFTAIMTRAKRISLLSKATRPLDVLMGAASFRRAGKRSINRDPRLTNVYLAALAATAVRECVEPFEVYIPAMSRG